MTPIDQQALMATMLAHAGPQKEQGTAYSPGTPIAPTPGITLPDGPRGWTFPIGYNIGQLPRSTEVTSFETLRNLASLYDGVLLCEQVWFDLCSKLEMEIKPRPHILAQAGGDASVFEADIAAYLTFFETPDRKNGLDLHSWLQKAIREQLELDALAIHVLPNKAGGVHSLRVIDGSTMKPLIDAYGDTPQPPFPAYQQFWMGVPLGWYTTDQILYHRETVRADSVYGLSRVERIILRVNQALRKQNKDLAYFTEGNLPLGILKMPETDTNEWTPDQVLAFQQIWDGLLSGNDKLRSRLKVVPPGSEFQDIEKQDDLLTKFDTFLLNVAAACFGLTMAELAFTENVNKSSGDSQENVTYRRAMRPLMNRYAKLFTMILKKYFREDRFIITWKGYEEAEDLATQAKAYSELTNAGILDVQTAATLMNLPFEEAQPVPHFVLTKDGPVFFKDVLDPTSVEAKRQILVAQAQQGAPPPEEEENEDDTQSQHASKGTQGTSTARPANESAREDAPGDQTAHQRRAEYRKWREVALKDVKAGKPIRPFVSLAIPAMEQERISYALKECQSLDDVKRVFEAERALEASED